MNLTEVMPTAGPHDTRLVLGFPQGQAEGLRLSGHVAQMVVDAAADGRMERAAPRSGAVLANLGYLFPWMRQLLQPWLEAKGRRVRARLKAEAKG